jgi:DnaJ-class molecular chaperone
VTLNQYCLYLLARGVGAEPPKFVKKVCPDCNGSGFVDAQECELCGGVGFIFVEQIE